MSPATHTELEIQHGYRLPKSTLCLQRDTGGVVSLLEAWKWRGGRTWRRRLVSQSRNKRDNSSCSIASATGNNIQTSDRRAAAGRAEHHHNSIQAQSFLQTILYSSPPPSQLSSQTRHSSRHKNQIDLRSFANGTLEIFNPLAKSPPNRQNRKCVAKC